MGFPLTPTIDIGGEVIACTVEAIESEPVAIDGIEIDWGRDGYIARGGGAGQCRLTLVDTTTTWARRVRQNTAIGLSVVITVGEAPNAVTVFRGWITEADAAPMGRRRTDDGRRWWTIALICNERPTVLGNEIVTADWPPESAVQRAVRIRDLANLANADVDAVAIDTAQFGAPMGPLEVREKSVMELVNGLYESLGAYSWGYDGRTIWQEYRLAGELKMRLIADITMPGAVTIAAGDLPTPGIAGATIVRRGTALHGCQLEADIKLHADGSRSLNRVRATYKDGAGEDAHIQKSEIRADDGPRALTFETWINDRGWIDGIVQQVWQRIRDEGARPRHPDITARIGHELTRPRDLHFWFTTWQSSQPAYIAGDMAHEWLMSDDAGKWPPVVAAIGGKMDFDPVPGWTVTLHVQWLAQHAAESLPMTWAGLRQVKTTTTPSDAPWTWPGLGWPAPPAVQYGAALPLRDIRWGRPAAGNGEYRWAPSLTWADMRHPNDVLIDDLDAKA